MSVSADVSVNRIRVTHIGGPTVLIEFGGWCLLTDPTFDPAGRDYHFGLGTGSRKLRGPALRVEDLPPIDAVLLSHDHHADNLDDAGRALLPKAKLVLTTESGAKRLQGNARGLATWSTTKLEHAGRPTVEVTATPCRHGPPGSHFLVGDVIGFALRWEGQQFGAVWISGDTVFYSGVRDVADRVNVGTMLLHLGGVQFGLTGPLHYTMTARDAVRTVEMMKPRTVLPIHYEGWGHFHEGRDAVEGAFAPTSDGTKNRVRWLVSGQASEVDV